MASSSSLTSNKNGNSSSSSRKLNLTRTLTILTAILGLLLFFGFVEIETFLLASSRSLSGGVTNWASTITFKGSSTSSSSSSSTTTSTDTSSSSSFCPINSSSYLEWAQSLPKYDLGGSFCSLLPADLSPTYLWNQHLEWILDATLHSLPNKNNNNNNEVDDEEEEATIDWMSDLLLWLTPQHLRKGYLGRAEHDAWGQVLHHLYQRRTWMEQENLDRHSQTSPQQQQQQHGIRPLHVVILGGSVAQGVGSCQPPPHLATTTTTTTTTTTSRRRTKSKNEPNDDNNCGWSYRLEHFLNHILGGTTDQPMVQVTRWTVPDTTTEFATSIVEHGLWPPHTTTTTTSATNNNTLPSSQGPDVIINAYSSHDMYLPEQGLVVDTDDFNYTNHRRQVTQAFLRAALHSRPCAAYPPLVIHLDDYLGHHHETVLAELTNARVLQQMSDWYQVPLISYANVVRRWVYADITEQVFSPNWHDTNNNNNGEQQDQPQPLTNNVHYGLVAHVGVLWTMAFSFLSATVEYCSHEIMRLDEYPFVTKEIMDLVAHVPPPELNADLCLSNISEKWQEEKIQMQERRARVCYNHDNNDNNNNNNGSRVGDAAAAATPHRKDLPHCVLAFWPGYYYNHHGQSNTLQSYLQPWIQEQVGWTASTTESDRGGGLVATKAGAKLRLHVPIVSSATSLQRLELFVLRHVDWKDTAVKWDVRVWNTTQEWNHTMFVEAFHNADVTQMAYPIHLDLPFEVTQGHEIDMTLELVQGRHFEIKSIILCNSLLA